MCGIDPTIKQCNPLTQFSGGESHLFTIVTQVQFGNYDVHVYKLCVEEAAENITINDVLERGKLCPRPPMLLTIAIEFTGCNIDFDTNSDFTMYEFINDPTNLDCPFKQRFVLVNTTGIYIYIYFFFACINL